MNAGTAIAIVLGPLLFRWLANHERFTLALVKLEAGVVFGIFVAIVVGAFFDWKLSGDTDFRIVGLSALAFIALSEWRSSRRPAVKHYDADEIEIIPPERPQRR